MRRVVVTGMGIVSSIGNNTQEVLASLHEAKSGISRADKHAELGFRCQVHGAPTLNAEETVDRLTSRVAGVTSFLGKKLLRAAARAREAVADFWAEAQSIRSGDVATARRDLQNAERALETIEKFLGR